MKNVKKKKLRKKKSPNIVSTWIIPKTDVYTTLQICTIFTDNKSKKDLAILCWLPL